MNTLKNKLFIQLGLFVMAFALTLVSAGHVNAQDTALTAYQPFIGNGTMTSIGIIVQFHLPAGKRYVIEHITADFVTPHGVTITTITLKTFVGKIAAVHVLPRPSLTYTETLPGNVKKDHYILSLATRLYADGGNDPIENQVSLVCGVSGSFTIGPTEPHASFSGYLVNIP